MINEEELRISNKSYINKDFASIYPEVVEFIQKETTRWDPETSNESDPGVIILKVICFIADKLNYNIDKNVLENYMLSATQESSMRKLCDMLGYAMKYFVAPETKLTLTYTDELTSPIKFNALGTVFTSTNDDTNISFISTRDVTLSKQNEVQTVPVIQGVLRELKVNTSGDVTSNNIDKPLIQLINLDDNNRVYFPETNVAENGVFILDSTLTGEFWEVKKTLNDVVPLTKCFKFGFDSSRDLPYIEFPKDIASIIGNGLYIRYIVTDGIAGNVSANVINALDSDDSESWSALKESNENAESNLYVRNYSATINGMDPETINEAYNNFKRIIGTFNTLTTCRDYANAIYSLFDEDGVFPLVSNVQVSDRRSDINYSKRVMSHDELGDVIINKTDASKLNAYELCCYPLAPIYTFTDTNQYNKSFTPLTTSGRTITSEIASGIEKYKTISHDYKILDDEDIYAFKNKLKLECYLTPTYKVNAYEAVDIDTNVINQLIKDFNSREVDYGYKIPFESLYDSIKKSDKRINYVSLFEPELTTYVLTRDGDEIELLSSSGKDYYVSLLAKNILNGNISLFNYDDRFNFELGQEKISGKDMINEKVESITSELSLTLTSGVDTPLYKNEALQFIAPNTLTELTIPAYCYFRFVSTTHTESNPILANTVYEIRPGEDLYISYTENDIVKTSHYVEGDIIKPVGFNLFNTPNQKTSSPRSTFQRVNEIDPSQEYFFSLGASESIEIQKINKVVLTTKTKCYWLRNNAENRLFTNDEWDNITNTGTAILKEGEYFFYTDAAETQLISLGSGTTITSKLLTLKTITADVVDISDVLESGMLALKDKWKVITLTPSVPLTVQENNILTLTEGDIVKANNGSITVTSTLTPLPSGTTITYSIDGGEPQQLYNMDITNGEWQVRSKLHINVSKNEPQIINEGIDNVSNRQSVTFNLDGGSSVVLNASGQHFNLNTEMHNEGGIIDTTVIVKDESGQEITTYPVTMYCYNVAVDGDDNPQTPERDLNDYAYYALNSDVGEEYEFVLPTVENNATRENAIMMIYVYKTNTGDAGNVTLTLSNGAYECQAFNPVTDDYQSSMTLNNGINVIDLHRLSSSDVTTMTLTNSGVDGALTIGTLDFYSGLNDYLGIEDFVEKTGSQSITKASVEKDLMDAIRDDDFYYNCKIDNSKAIESISLISPHALYDANNVANKFTISQIDFKNSVIDIVKTSKK